MVIVIKLITRITLFKIKMYLKKNLSKKSNAGRNYLKRKVLNPAFMATISIFQNKAVSLK